MVEASDPILGVLDPEMAAIVHSYLQRQDIELCLADRVVSMEGSSQEERVVLNREGYRSGSLA